MIRLATMDELDWIMEIYAAARAFMRAHGNPTQWGTDYPSRAMLEEDIRRGELYVFVQAGQIHGVFMLMTGAEPTYATIEQGAWLDDGDYATIHRVAADGRVKGVFLQCLTYCKQKHAHLRIDTHHKNHVMQHLIEKGGFQKCGVIYVEDGSPRIAYEYVKGQQ